MARAPYIDIEPAFDECVREAGGLRLEEIVGKSPNFNNADYIFENHSVIAELKCLEENKGKDEKLRNDVHELYNRYLREGRTNLLIYGEIEVNLADISDEFAREVMEMYTIPIQRVVKKANRQIRQTKSHLDLKDYSGVLLLVNDGHEILSPGQLQWILQNTLYRNLSSTRKCNSQLVFLTEEDFVWCSEAEAFSGAMIESMRSVRNFVLGDCGQVPLFGKVLA